MKLSSVSDDVLVWEPFVHVADPSSQPSAHTHIHTVHIHQPPCEFHLQWIHLSMDSCAWASITINLESPISAPPSPFTLLYLMDRTTLKMEWGQRWRICFPGPVPDEPELISSVIYHVLEDGELAARLRTSIWQIIDIMSQVYSSTVKPRLTASYKYEQLWGWKWAPGEMLYLISVINADEQLEYANQHASEMLKGIFAPFIEGEVHFKPGFRLYSTISFLSIRRRYLPILLRLPVYISCLWGCQI